MWSKRLLVGLVSCCLITSSCASLHGVPLRDGSAPAVPAVERGERTATRFDHDTLQSLEVYRRGTAAKVAIGVGTALAVIGAVALAALLHYIRVDKRSD